MVRGPLGKWEPQLPNLEDEIKKKDKTRNMIRV